MAEIKNIADFERKPVKIWYAFVYKGVSDIQEGQVFITNGGHKPEVQKRLLFT